MLSRRAVQLEVKARGEQLRQLQGLNFRMELRLLASLSIIEMIENETAANFVVVVVVVNKDEL